MKAPRNPNPNDTRETNKKLNFEDLKRILFLSFRFSQGSPELQELILKHVRLYYGKQRLLTELKKSELDGYIIDALIKMRSQDLHPDEESVFENNYDKQIKNVDPKQEQRPSTFLETLSIDLEMDDEGLFRLYNSLLGQMWVQEAEFSFGKRKGKDPNMSFFVDYIIRDTKTGDASFDSMFEKIRKYLPVWFNEELSANRIAGSFLEQILYYNETHPNTPVKLEELKRVGVV